MSLSKLLTQNKSKVGCFNTGAEDDNVMDKMSNVNSLTMSQKKSRHMLRKNLTRGYSDPESKTTRLSLCCAVTESSSHTPPHSNHFQTTQLGSRTCDDDSHVVQTRDCESQTVDSNPECGMITGTPIKKSTIETTVIADAETQYVPTETCKNDVLYTLNNQPSGSLSPVKFADEDEDEDEEIASSGSSNSLTLCQSDDLVRRHHTKRLSVDNLIVSPPSPPFSVRHSSPDSVKSVPELKDRRRRMSHDSARENKMGSKLEAGDGENSRHVSMDSLARQSLLAAQVLHLIPTEKARERNFLHGRIGANSMLGPVELDRVLPKREIKIFVGTWNMNGEPPPPELNDFMLPNGLEHIPDVIAVGTQESSPERFDWEVKIQETIGPSHVLFHSAALGTIHLAIFLRRDLLWYCSVAEESSLSVRPGMAFRTKGAVAIAFILFGTSYLFITSHLTAHQDKVKERIHDVKRIVRSLDLPKNLPLRHRLKSKGTCLSTFQEGSITFPPTYKYDVGTQNFDTSSKQRTPAYTDRILFKSKGGNLSCITYSSVPTICTSDHKPVWGVYRGTVRPGIDTIPLSAGLFNREVYLEGIKRRAADLGRRDLGLAAFCSIQ
ncbi:hypothetical protein RUM43_004471 [Polyplax serrata]|uniref:Inositol polyphosphate-related phosphatase domain-containing protein n=1 Tax=Polyplax serrata TaxID=468196 RepID=A0AAN8XLI7_POLSC